MVVGMYQGHKQEGLAACREMPEHFQSVTC